MAGRIELKTTDLYHRNKRNLMLLCSAILVVGLAGPSQQIKIPGFGEEVKLSTPVAFTIAFIGVIYFFFQFFVDWRTARAINSEGISAISANDLDAGIGSMAQQIKDTNGALLASFDQLQPIIGNLATLKFKFDFEFKPFAEKIIDNWPPLLPMIFSNSPELISADPDSTKQIKAQIAGQIADRFSWAENQIKQLEAQISSIREEASPHLQSVADQSAAYHTTLTKLTNQLTKLSRTISGVQRFNFGLDIALCALMSVASLITTLIVIFHPGWTWPCRVI